MFIGNPLLTLKTRQRESEEFTESKKKKRKNAEKCRAASNVLEIVFVGWRIKITTIIYPSFKFIEPILQYTIFIL